MNSRLPVVGRSISSKITGAVWVFYLAATSTSSAQSFTTLVNFNGTNGRGAYGSLVQGTDGNFYGTTSAGGANNQGSVFKLTPGGTLTSLHSFSGTDGALPRATLIQGTDGNFYGTTSYGGANSD